MKVQALPRRFQYQGTLLPDPNPDMDPEKVKHFFVNQYPELHNASIEGPEINDNGLTFTFVRSIGTKG